MGVPYPPMTGFSEMVPRTDLQKCSPSKVSRYTVGILLTTKSTMEVVWQPSPFTMSGVIPTMQVVSVLLIRGHPQIDSTRRAGTSGFHPVGGSFHTPQRERERMRRGGGERGGRCVCFWCYNILDHFETC